MPEKVEKEKGCSAAPDNSEQKKLKPCCACPETKQVRDQCIIEKGEESCAAEIEAHKQFCEREIVDLEAKIDTSLEELRNLQADSIAEVNATCQCVRDLLLQLNTQLEQLHALSQKARNSEARASAAAACRNHRVAAQRSAKQLRDAAAAAIGTLETNQRHQLLSTSKWRAASNSTDLDHPFNQTQSHSNGVKPGRQAAGATERLALLVAQMNDQVSLTDLVKWVFAKVWDCPQVASSEATLGQLTQQSAELEATEVEFRTMGATIDSSGKLLTKYSRRAATDRILIALALCFFIGTVLYIVRKRFGFPNVFGLFWQ